MMSQCMRPTEAEGGPWALQALYRALEENDPFQVAVIDMQMPGMDGEATARAIKADQRLADIRILILTSPGFGRGPGVSGTSTTRQERPNRYDARIF